MDKKTKQKIGASSPYNDGWTREFHQKELNKMNKKDLLKALGGALLFGVLTFIFMQVFIFFIEEQVIPDEIFSPPFEIDYRVLPDDTQTHPVNTVLPRPKFEIRIQNSFDDQLLEVTTTIEDALKYLTEYSRFHDDLYVYDIKTRELLVDSRTFNEALGSLKLKEELLIEAAGDPTKFTEEEIFELLVD